MADNGGVGAVGVGGGAGGVGGSKIKSKRTTTAQCSESSTILHAPENLQPLRLNKSRNEIHHQDHDKFTTQHVDLKMNPLSPEPLRPIPKMKSAAEDAAGSSRYQSSFKDVFM